MIDLVTEPPYKHLIDIDRAQNCRSMCRPIYGTIERAVRKAKERKWDTLYWAIDLHDTIIKPTYDAGSNTTMYPHALDMLGDILRHPENKIILWSSMPVYRDSAHDTRNTLSHFKHYLLDQILPSEEAKGYENFYHRIMMNENQRVPDTAYADFSRKFYFNILLDDKAGFEPEDDIPAVRLAVDDFCGRLQA